MNNRILKKNIYEAFRSITFDSNVDKLITSCLLYDYTKKVLARENDISNNVRGLVESYTSSYKNILENFKSRFISYTIMVRTIESYRKNVFTDFTESEINAILEYYQNRAEIAQFSTTYFSQYMYKIVNMKQNLYTKLSETHFTVMVPIIKYYMDNFGLNQSNLEIFDAEVYLQKPGKEILFGIKGISPARVVADITSGNIAITYQDIGIVDQYVKIVIK
jgi:hypothetical protein